MYFICDLVFKILLYNYHKKAAATLKKSFISTRTLHVIQKIAWNSSVSFIVKMYCHWHRTRGKLHKLYKIN